MRSNSNPSGAPTKLCPRCHSGSIMIGRQAQYNARSAVDNIPICAECRLKEILARALNG